MMQRLLLCLLVISYALFVPAYGSHLPGGPETHGDAMSLKWLDGRAASKDKPEDERDKKEKEKRKRDGGSEKDRRSETERPARDAAYHPVPLVADCIYPGYTLLIERSSLVGTPASTLLMSGIDGHVTLKRIGNSGSQLHYQISVGTTLSEGEIYTIYVSNADFKKVILKAQVCSKAEPKTISVAPAPKSFETTIVPPSERNSVVLLIENRPIQQVVRQVELLGLKLLKRRELKYLELTLLVFQISGNSRGVTLQELKKLFPDAAIDMDTDYPAAAGPRTYAKAMLGWPVQCEKKSYEMVTIGVIDGHPNLNEAPLLGQNISVKRFLNEGDVADNVHATDLAELLVGQSPIFDLQGLLPGARVLAAAVLRKKSTGVAARASSIIEALNWLLGENVRLINISLSGFYKNHTLEKAISVAQKNGALIFAAAGNDREVSRQVYPAAFAGVFAATAIDKLGRRYTEANQGQFIDFAAPGVDIWVHGSQSVGSYKSGTSYASPFVMAVAASYLKRNQAMSRDILYQALQFGSIDMGQAGFDAEYGWGLVQASADACQ